jgi:hypothetical protein
VFIKNIHNLLWYNYHKKFFILLQNKYLHYFYFYNPINHNNNLMDIINLLQDIVFRYLYVIFIKYILNLITKFRKLYVLYFCINIIYHLNTKYFYNNHNNLIFINYLYKFKNFIIYCLLLFYIKIFNIHFIILYFKDININLKFKFLIFIIYNIYFINNLINQYSYFINHFIK